MDSPKWPGYIWKGQPCPKCKRKGLHRADHPHALGWKDPNHISCRFCHTVFNEEKLILYFEKLNESKQVEGK